MYTFENLFELKKENGKFFTLTQSKEQHVQTFQKIFNIPLILR